MPQNYEVSYDRAGSLIPLTNVQSVNYRWGRQKITDQWTPNSGTVVFRAPDYFANPIPELVPGCVIRVTNLTTAQEIFYAVIADVQAEYGIPYADNVGPSDYVTLTLEGSFAEMGRNQGLNYSMAAGLASTQLSTASTQTGVSIGNSFTGANDVNVGAATVSGSWGEWLSRWLITTGGSLRDSLVNPVVAPPLDRGTGLNFSDTTNSSLQKKYFKLDFSSLSDNYYTEVEVDPAGFASSFARVGAEPYRTIKLDTYSASALDGQLLADYYLAFLKDSQIEPVSVSMLAEAQAVQNIDSNFVGRTNLRSLLTFRGTTTSVISIGGVLSVTPEEMIVTCYLTTVTGTGTTYNTPVQYNQTGYYYND
jgi:hypothetical protein